MTREYTDEEKIAHVLGASENTVVTFPGTIWIATSRGNIFFNDSSHPRDRPMMVNVYFDDTFCGLLGDNRMSEDPDWQELVMEKGREFSNSYEMMLHRGGYRLKSKDSPFHVPEELLYVEKNVDRFPLVGELAKYSVRKGQ
jgi:hypothetical protein